MACTGQQSHTWTGTDESDQEQLQTGMIVLSPLTGGSAPHAGVLKKQFLCGFLNQEHLIGVEVEPSSDPWQNLHLLGKPDCSWTQVMGEPQILPHYQGFREHSPIDLTISL